MIVFWVLRQSQNLTSQNQNFSSEAVLDPDNQYFTEKQKKQTKNQL